MCKYEHRHKRTWCPLLRVPKPIAITPWLAQEPVGPEALRELTQSVRDIKITAEN